MSKLVGFFALAALGLGVSVAGAQTSPDSTVADPVVHRVVLENEHVRVLQGLASPGWKSAMHSHPPTVVISIGTARVRMTYPDGKKELFDIRPGQVFWIDGAEHSWELIAGEVNVVAVEVKSAKGAKAAATPK